MKRLFLLCILTVVMLVFMTGCTTTSPQKNVTPEPTSVKTVVTTAAVTSESSAGVKSGLDDKGDAFMNAGKFKEAMDIYVQALANSNGKDNYAQEKIKLLTSKLSNHSSTTESGTK